MFRLTLTVLTIIFALTTPHEVKQLDSLFCWTCQGGFETPCAQVTLTGRWKDCGPNSNCYEAVISYNNGALKLVQRQCFSPPNNDTSLNFCNTPQSSPNVKIEECYACNTTKCNGHLIQPKNYGHDGRFLINQTSIGSKIISPIMGTFDVNDYYEAGI